MDPNIAAGLAQARHAETLRTAESHHNAMRMRVLRPADGPTVRTLSKSAAETAQRLRQRVGQLRPLGAPRQPAPEPCC